jgi:hypothetical protein
MFVVVYNKKTKVNKQKVVTYSKLHHERVNDTANNSDKVKGIPGILEVTL